MAYNRPYLDAISPSAMITRPIPAIIPINPSSLSACVSSSSVRRDLCMKYPKEVVVKNSDNCGKCCLKRYLLLGQSLAAYSLQQQHAAADRINDRLKKDVDNIYPVLNLFLLKYLLLQNLQCRISLKLYHHLLFVTFKIKRI